MSTTLFIWKVCYLTRKRIDSLLLAEAGLLLVVGVISLNDTELRGCCCRLGDDWLGVLVPFGERDSEHTRLVRADLLRLQLALLELSSKNRFKLVSLL